MNEGSELRGREMGIEGRIEGKREGEKQEVKQTGEVRGTNRRDMRGAEKENGGGRGH